MPGITGTIGGDSHDAVVPSTEPLLTPIERLQLFRSKVDAIFKEGKYFYGVSTQDPTQFTINNKAGKEIAIVGKNLASASVWLTQCILRLGDSPVKTETNSFTVEPDEAPGISTTPIVDKALNTPSDIVV